MCCVGGGNVQECNQEPGDLLYVPSSLVRVSVNLQDSISIFERLLTSQAAAAESVDGKIWAPNSGRIPDGYAASACFGWDLEATGKGLGTKGSLGPQAQILQQILTQNFGGSVYSENYLILKVLAECSAAIEAPSVNAARTLCAKAWSACTARLEANIADLPGATWPEGIPKAVEVVDTGDEAGQQADASSGDTAVADDDGKGEAEEGAKSKKGNKKKSGKKKKSKSDL